MTRLALLALLILLTGCYSYNAPGPLDADVEGELVGLFMRHPSPPEPAIDAGPAYDRSGRARSYVLDAPKQRRLTANAAKSRPDPGRLPWYTSRLDRRPAVVLGYESLAYHRAETYTVDRLYTSRGRVFDYYHQTTYRQRVQEAVR